MKNKWIFNPLSTLLLTSFICSLLILLILIVPVNPANAAALERQTTEGKVLGEQDTQTQTIIWKAIPYAKPPVGDLRWRSPQPPKKRNDVLTADEFCELCPQYKDTDQNRETPQIIIGQEDCLYLNIWSPKNAKPVNTEPKNTNKGLPVFFWIHGGGNSIQWPTLSWLDAGILANHGNMVVVTFNYRLGPMGFFNHPALKTGDKEGDSGNFALLDQISALKWVRANIKNFGGNPDNITIAGESAGGQNVLCLVASPLARGLFHRAISQSGVIMPSTPQKGVEHANKVIAKMMIADGKATDEKTAAALLAGMSTKDIETYLRSKQPSEFLATYPEGAVSGMIMFPTAFGDGHVLPKEYYEALTSGNYNKVPMILGSNKEETKLFTQYRPPFSDWIKDRSLYTNPEKAELYEKVNEYQSAGWKAMGVDEPARIMRGHKDQPDIYTYQFLWGAGGPGKEVMVRPYNVLFGACHAMEIDFVFGTDDASLGAFFFNYLNREGRVALSNAMMNYWSEFARTGNPNNSKTNLPRWISWSNDKGPKTIQLSADVNKAIITMSDKEVTNKTLEEALKKEKLQPQIQPFWDNALIRRK